MIRATVAPVCELESGRPELGGTASRMSRTTWRRLLSQHEAVQDEHIQSGTIEDPHSVCGAADNGFVKAVERRVDEHAGARCVLEPLQQLRQGAGLRRHSLDANR